MTDPNRLCPGCMHEWGRAQEPCPNCGFVEMRYERPARQLPLRYILNGKYMTGKAIGEGGFGITYIGWDLNLQVRVAVKEYFPVSLAARESGQSSHILALPGVRQENYRQGLEKFMTEARTLSKFYDLPGIVTVKDFFFENDTAYMIMEYVDGITLGSYLKQHGQITEQEALVLFYPVMESLKTVHQAGIIHRDISPDNIMMTTDGRMKLIDFGAARFAGGDTERSLTIILKHGYAPAEQYQSHGNQGPWTDIYAICATMYRMITGKVPPSAMDRLHEDTLEEFASLNCRVSDQTAYAIIDRGMAIRVADRYQSMDELMQGLYGTDGKKVRRVRKQGENGMAPVWKWGAAGAAVLVCVLGITGMFLLNGLKGREAGRIPAGTAESFADGSGGSQIPGAGGSGGDPISGGSGSENMPAPGTDDPEGELAPGSDGPESSRPSDSGSQGNSQENPPVFEWPEFDREELAGLRAEAESSAQKLAAGGYHMLMAQENGTVAALGSNIYGELDVEHWSGMKAVYTGKYHTLGLRTDGTVRAAGYASYGECAVDSWKDIVQAAAGNLHSVGLRGDGTVTAVGDNRRGQCDVFEWSDIIQVAAGADYTLGLRDDGTVAAAGSSAGCETGDWTDIVSIRAGDAFSAGLRSDGTVVLAGQAEEYQEAEDWKQVIQVVLGRDYIAGLLADGRVVAAGKGSVTQKNVEAWKDIVSIAGGDQTVFGMDKSGRLMRTTYSYGTVSKEEFTGFRKVVSGGGYLLGLREDGTVASWGVSGTDFGQSEVDAWTDICDIAASGSSVLGLRSDGTVIGLGAASSEVENWTDIVSVVLAGNTPVGLKSDGTMVSVAEADMPEEKAAAIAGSLTGKWAFIDTEGALRESNWRNIEMLAENVQDVSVGTDHVAAVRSDGTAYAHGGSGSYMNVYGWKNLVQIAAGEQHTVGLGSSGLPVAAGSNTNGQLNLGSWEDVVYIAVGNNYTLGLQSDGTLLIAGKLPGEY